MEDDDAGKAARPAALKQWVQASVDHPENLDATTVYARARKAIDQAVKLPRKAFINLTAWTYYIPGLSCISFTMTVASS